MAFNERVRAASIYLRFTKNTNHTGLEKTYNYLIR